MTVFHLPGVIHDVKRPALDEERDRPGSRPPAIGVVGRANRQGVRPPETGKRYTDIVFWVESEIEKDVILADAYLSQDRRTIAH